jgi:hypothetical protein
MLNRRLLIGSVAVAAVAVVGWRIQKRGLSNPLPAI